MGAGVASIFADYIFAEGIMVDAKNGQRFVNELGTRRERSEAEMKCVDQNGKPVFPFGFCSEGTTKCSGSVEELAWLYGAPVEPLKKQIVEWNEAVKAGKDSLFGKPIDKRI